MLKPKQNIHGFIIPNSDKISPLTAAGVLDCSRDHVCHLIHHGELKADNASTTQISRWEISRTALIDFIIARTTIAEENIDTSNRARFDGLLPEFRIMDAHVVADFLQCSHSHILNLIQSRKITATDLAVRCNSKRKWLRITKDSLTAFIVSNLEGDY
ncbi:hypothetical protein P4E94_14800 [Pontiellaceae bacterium B12219]|nr:hypothetical protein [Pontiellaceae bacterium B12219]